MGKHTRPRAERMATKLTPEVAAIIKGMLERRDRQSDIAAFFQINQGRIVEIKSGKRFRSVYPAPPECLPEPGPYVVVAKARHVRAALAEETLTRITEVMRRALRDVGEVLGADIKGTEDATEQ